MTELLVILAVAAAAYGLYRYLEYRKAESNSTTVAGKESAFAKAATVAEKHDAAEGKIAAIQALTAAQQVKNAALKAVAVETHAAIDEVHKDADTIHAILG